MSISNRYRDHARALLFAKGIDPNPSNVSKITQEPGNPLFGNAALFGLERKNYWVFEGTSIINILIEVLLRHPQILPAKYLALFISGAFHPDTNFDNIIRVAELLRKNHDAESKFALMEFIQMDNFLNEHIQEVLEFEYGTMELGIPKIMGFVGFDEILPVTYRDKCYWVLGYHPSHRLLVECLDELKEDHCD